MDLRVQERLVSVSFALCASLANLPAAALEPRQNVLLILADDFGFESLATIYPGVLDGTDPRLVAEVPTLDALASQGMVFNNLWTSPTCSPTRAAILTGRYGFRTGVVKAVRSTQPLIRLHTDEVTIPRALQLAGVDIATAAFGKWHLSNCLNGREYHPQLEAGFDRFRGTLSNANVNYYFGDGTPPFSGNYYKWVSVSDGLPTVIEDGVDGSHYLTTDTVRDAKEFIEEQVNDPWFVFLALHAAHRPFMAPPDRLDDPAVQENGFCNLGERWKCHKWMIESLDEELGGLLGVIDYTDTTVVFLTDNGPPDGIFGDLATAYPRTPNHVKKTVYQGGINMPLIVAGAAVANPGTYTDALVTATDLFDTVISLVAGPAQIAPRRPDSFSLAPLLAGTGSSGRDFAFSEGEEKLAIRGARYKLIRDRTTGVDTEFFDLDGSDRYTELNNLCGGVCPGTLTGKQLTAYDGLTRKLDDLLEPTLDACPVNLADCDECCTNTPGGYCSVDSFSLRFETCAPSLEPCEIEDLGMAACYGKDGEPFRCRGGGTVHTMECTCDGPEGHCANADPDKRRKSRQLVCLEPESESR